MSTQQSRRWFPKLAFSFSLAVLLPVAFGRPAALAAESDASRIQQATPDKPATATPAPKAATNATKTETKAPTKTNKAAVAEETLKGEMVCAKCTLHEASSCQGVLQVKDASGAETKYYLKNNKVARKQHERVCSGSAPATVTGAVATEGDKKVITASSVKYD